MMIDSDDGPPKQNTTLKRKKIFVISSDEEDETGQVVAAKEESGRRCEIFREGSRRSINLEATASTSKVKKNGTAPAKSKRPKDR